MEEADAAGTREDPFRRGRKACTSTNARPLRARFSIIISICLSCRTIKRTGHVEPFAAVGRKKWSVVLAFLRSWHYSPTKVLHVIIPPMFFDCIDQRSRIRFNIIQIIWVYTLRTGPRNNEKLHCALYDSAEPCNINPRWFSSKLLRSITFSRFPFKVRDAKNFVRVHDANVTGNRNRFGGNIRPRFVPQRCSRVARGPTIISYYSSVTMYFRRSVFHTRIQRPAVKFY